MEQKQLTDSQYTTDHTSSKALWTTPVLTKLKVEDAESGNNISENGATGS